MASSSLHQIYDILWSPNSPSHFLVVSSNSIQLYECHFTSPSSNHNDCIVLGNKTLFVRRIKQVKESEPIKCMAWQTSAGETNASFTSPDHLLAIAFAGKVVLTSFIQCAPSEDQLGLDKKILIPRYARNTLFLSWNPWKKNLLAQGLEKSNRQQNREPFLLIWDVCRGDDLPSGSVQGGSGGVPSGSGNLLSSPGADTRVGFIGGTGTGANTFASNAATWGSWTGTADRNSATSATAANNAGQQIQVDKPLSECGAGMNDTIHGFAWLSKDCFVVGMNGKYLRIYDITDTSKHLKETSHRPIQEIFVEPASNGRRFATYGERNVAVWDIETFDKPTASFSVKEDIEKVVWCPTKKNVLGVLLRDADCVRVYDTGNLVQVDSFDDEVDQSLVTRVVRGHHLKKLTSFQWHAEVPHLLLLVDADGVLDVGILRDRPVVTWSPDQTLAHVTSQHHFILHSAAGSLSNHRSFLEQDICHYMMERAIAGYGTQECLPSYSKLLAGDAKLIEFWKWLERIQNIHWDNNHKSKGSASASQNVGSRGSVKSKGILSPGPPSSATSSTIGSHHHSSSSSTTAIGGGSSVELSQWRGVMPLLQTANHNTDNSFYVFSSDTVRMNQTKWEGHGNVCFPLPQYRSDARSNILRFCLWPSARDQIPAFIEEIYNNNEVDRAAALALFQLRFSHCLTILTTAAGELRRNERLRGVSGVCPTSPGGMTTPSVSSSDLEKIYLCVVSYDSSTKALATTLNATIFTSNYADEFVSPNVLTPNQLGATGVGTAGTTTSLGSTGLSGGVSGAGVGSGIGSRNMAPVSQAPPPPPPPLSIGNSSGTTTAATITASMADKIAEWARSCEDIVSRLNSAYLQAMFHFLSADRSSDLNIILDNPGIKLGDRVALACLYLSDKELHQRLQQYLEESLKQGHLAGVVLTGLNTPQFVQLLQGYLDRTDDIQTVAIVVLHAIQMGNHHLAEFSSAYHWVLTYRDLLDRWRLWYHRAEFDIAHHAGMTLLMAGRPTFDNTTMACQVFVSCYYCGHRISQHHNMSSSTAVSSNSGTSGPGQHRILGGFTQQSQQRIIASAGSSLGGGGGGLSGSSASPSSFSAHMQAGGGKVTICQQCRKALPRCSVCLMHMGTGSGTNQGQAAGGHSMNATPAFARQLSHSGVDGLDKRGSCGPSSTPQYLTATWFSWCQQCRHGGHAAHLMRWFREYSVCPVSGCKCKCVALDKPLLAPARDFDPQKLASCYLPEGEQTLTGNSGGNTLTPGRDVHPSGSSVFGLTGDQEQFRQMATDRLNKLMMNKMSVL